MAGAKDLFHGVQDTGPDVAIYNANGAQSKRR